MLISIIVLGLVLQIQHAVSAEEKVTVAGRTSIATSAFCASVTFYTSHVERYSCIYNYKEVLSKIS